MRWFFFTVFVINACVNHRVSCTVISNLNLIFETFSPLSMVRFFEFNDVGWNISEKCIKDMFLYLDALHKDVFWAVKLYDASGYYSGGIYAGNNIRKGNAQLCRDLNRDVSINSNNNNNNNNKNGFHGLHEIQPTIYEDIQDFLTLAKYLPFTVKLVNAKYKMIVENSPYTSYIIHQTVCLPKSCNYFDLQQVMSYAPLPHMRNGFIVKSTELMELRLMEEKYQFHKESGFYLLLMLTTIFTFFGLVGTIYENFTNFEVNVNFKKIERQHSINAIKAQSNKLNNLDCVENQGNKLKRSTENKQKSCEVDYMKAMKVDPIAEHETEDELDENKNVNLVQFKEISTVSVDIITNRHDNYKRDSLDSSVMDRNNDSHITNITVRKMLLAFSWRRNFQILSSSHSKHCINEPSKISGLRMLCLLWIFLVHVCTTLYYISDNKLFRNHLENYNILESIINTGSLAVDTHFFVCGICVAHMFLNRLKRVDIENICSCFTNLLHFAVMIMYKCVSIIIPYIAVLLLLQLLMKYFQDFSVVDIPSIDHETCSVDTLWRNLFYIEQFYPLKDRCMIWSWIISLDIQFFIVASIILLILKNHPRYGIIIFSSILISSFVATTALRFHDQQRHNSNSSLMIEEQLAFYNSLYDQPWARLSPYFFGICMGYILYQAEEKLEMNIVIMTCGWIACIFLIIAVCFSKTFVQPSNQWISAILSTINHSIWSMILVWIILASVSKYRGFMGRLLSARILLPFSKLSNCFLIVHPLITRIIVLSSDGAFHMSIGFIITIYFGLLFITFLSSFLLYMLYEAPIEGLLRIIYNRKIR